MRFSPALLLLLPLTLAACESATPATDLRIKVMNDPAGKGLLAVPPACPTWHDVGLGAPEQNHHWPTFGCAEANNLAAQVEDPADLLGGQKLGAADPVVSAAAIARYRAGKTTPLIDPNANAPSTIMKMSDDRLGGAESK